MAADGAGPGRTVTVAEPVPALVPFGSDTEVTVKVAVEPGVTT